LFSDVTVTLITKYIGIELLGRTCLLKNISWLELVDEVRAGKNIVFFIKNRYVS